MNDDFLASQEGVEKLTKDVRSFSEALNALKAVFLQNRVRGETWLVQAHKQLGELLQVLKIVVGKYDELNSAEVLQMSQILIKHVKEFDYEDVHSEVSPEIFRAINNLAMSFSNSVSECLTGDQLQLSMIETRSFEDLSAANERQTSIDTSNYPQQLPNATAVPCITPTNDEVAGGFENDVLHQMDDGMDIALDRAKVLSKYMQDLLLYVKKKAQLEIAHANNLMKLCSQAKPTLTEQSFLPFQSVYCTAIDNDREFASNSLSLYQERILLQKFVEPLSAKKVEHDKVRKLIRDNWLKEKRKVEEAITNVKKSKSNYRTRMQEYQKAKDAALKAGSGTHHQAGGQHKHTSSGGNAATLAFANVLSSSNTSGKVERKRQKEEESITKATQAEVTYKNCVNEANKKMSDLEKMKIEYLKQLKRMNVSCDTTVKSATLSYLQMHQELFHPLPVLYQAMNEDAKEYEPGFQYQDFINLESTKLAGSSGGGVLSGSPQQLASRTFFKFESFSTEGGNIVSDTDSISSHDDITSSSVHPQPPRHSSIDDSLSSEDALDPSKDAVSSNNQLTVPSEPVTGFTPDSSPIVTKRQSNTKQAINKMKDMLMNRKTHKPLFFGIPFSQTIQHTHQQQGGGVVGGGGGNDGIPLIVKRCVACIDNSALSTKGIYRVNGVKHRVEKICNQLDISIDRVDLTQQSPHDVSGVLKFFLRQLPEPLMQFNLYSKFLQIGKDYQKLIQETNAIAEQHRQEGKDPPPPNSDQLDSIIKEIRKNVNLLPTANRNTLQYLIAHLTRVATFSKENKMDASNLAIIFGPTLMRPQTTDGNESLNTLMEMPFQSRIVEALLHHKDYIFGMLSHSAGNIFPYCGFNQEPPSTYVATSPEVKTTSHPPEGDSSDVQTTSSSSELPPRDSCDVQFTLDEDHHPPATTTQSSMQLTSSSSATTTAQHGSAAPSAGDTTHATAEQKRNNIGIGSGGRGKSNIQHSSRVNNQQQQKEKQIRKISSESTIESGNKSRVMTSSASSTTISFHQRNRRKSTSGHILIRDIAFDDGTTTTSSGDQTTAVVKPPPRINTKIRSLRMSLDNLRNLPSTQPAAAASVTSLSPGDVTNNQVAAADELQGSCSLLPTFRRSLSGGGGIVMTMSYPDDDDEERLNASSC